MNFKDILKAEVDRKKRQLEQNKDILVPNKTYFKRGDLVAKQEEDYWRKHKRLKEDTDEKKKTEAAKDTNKEKNDKEEEEKVSQLPRKEVVKRLRERGEPVRLFGESDYEAFQRLKKVEMLMPEKKEVEGFRNDFKAAMDQVDQEYYDEIIKATTSEGGLSRANNVTVKDDGTTKEDLEKMSEEIGQGDDDRDQEIILRVLKLILRLWGEGLNKRSEEEKRTMKGKESSAIHSQTVNYMKPLFRKLKQKKVDVDIKDSLAIIVKHMLDRHYIRAHEAYLEMAIGNAPWPIGVTMVGIHARTGREKISSRYVAHVLNDETQRKYIQGLKRLMAQCQRLFPTDPHRSVDFDSKAKC